jgi:hypothetical protein
MIFIVVAGIWLYFQFFSRVEGFKTVAPDATPAELIDVVYYINLDHRKDRNSQFLKEMEKISMPTEKIKRISGVYLKERGHLGCSLSHIKVLEDFIASDSSIQNALIMEDDFEWSQPLPVVQKILHDSYSIPDGWDVCMVAGSERDVVKSEHSFLRKVNACSTTSGFWVNRSFALTLLRNFKEGVKLLEKSYNEGTKETPYRGEFAVDQYWFSLQKSTPLWFITDPKLGKQRESFSDIERSMVDYHI